MKIDDLFDLKHTLADKFLEQFCYPWEALRGIGAFIINCGTELNQKEYKLIKPYVWVHVNSKVSSTAYIEGPCIIGAGSDIRNCAYIRGSVLIGEGCVVGNSTEIKNSILFDGVQVPHFNYVGDSILGYKAHMGAGAITSNVKSDKTVVNIKSKDEKAITGLKKLGSMLGDYVEVGCNSVLNPGTIIGKNTTIYPLSSVRGIIPENSIYKNSKLIIKKNNPKTSI